MPPSAAVNIDVGAEAVDDNSPSTTPAYLTVLGVDELRANSVFSGGIAALGLSDAFKSKSNTKKPLSKDFTYRLTLESKSRQPSPLKQAAQYLSREGMISLGGGLPSSAYFPFDHVSVGVPGDNLFSETDIHEYAQKVTIGKHDMKEGKSAYDLSVALNYGQGSGSPQMVRWVTEHTEIVHNPPYQDWAAVMTVGSTSAFEMCLRSFCNRGDYFIADEYAFCSAIEAGRGLGIEAVGIHMDSEGMIPSHLDEVLSNWDEKARKAPKPFLIYLVPTGQNPTGSTQGTQRRKEIYALAQKHDLIIVEDEPYYFLQMDKYVSGAGQNNGSSVTPKSHDEFLKSLTPSYLSMDSEGRVIRLDSFSKVIAPGSRCGWLTTSSKICERLMRHNEVTVQAPSGFSQAILFKLLDEHWGHGKYLDWLVHIRKEYSARRNIMLEACEKYIPREVASWTPPAAGMFLWFKINSEKHPAYGKKAPTEIEHDIFQAVVDQKTLLAKGSWFFAGPEGSDAGVYLRATFAAAEEGAMIEGIRRFANALRVSFGLPELQESA
ncbi:Aromatic/aminoadipate aminotransferase 1 [Orbilia blumenaviensis]|uniref:aromatic-amino-acid transaminase n=1 Tax=Orbilia blumenaviensis TaxID=1796055 RepID=A0AAV9VP60_9PEZI